MEFYQKIDMEMIVFESMDVIDPSDTVTPEVPIEDED